MLRLSGGSDCCLDLLCKPGFTRLVAAKEILSGALSSVPSRVMFFLTSEPANPVKALDRSDAATRRALPK